MFTSSTTVLSLVAALAAPAAAFFRMPCPGRILTERADPIISPGGVSGHVHTISGGNGFNFEMDYADARSSVCSSCPIKQDLSNYWTPKLYYQFENGSFQDVPQAGDGNGVYGGMTVYYLQRPGPNDDALKAFPEGFRMVAGDPFKRNSTTDFASQAISYVCLDYSGTSSQSSGLPTKNCPDGLRAQVFFPSCWDGVNLDSADHKSHMAYPASGAVDNGPCPASHPVHMVSIFYEVIYSTSGFANMWYGSGQPFVFAQGDPTGYGFHGDFVNGWDVDTLQSAIDTCTNDSGLLSDCPVLDLFTTAESQACIVPPSIDEAVTGVLPKLPGCNPVTQGPGEAAIITTCSNPSIGAYETYFTDVTSSLGYEYIGCGSDSSTRTLSSASEALGTMDVEVCVAYCSGKGYTYAGLEYSSQCYCGNSIADDRAPVTGVLGNCFSTCAGNSSEFCGGSNALSLYKKCDSGSSCTNLLYTYPGSAAAVVSSSSKSSSSTSSSKTTTASSATSSKTSTSTSATSVSTSAASAAATSSTSSTPSETSTTSTSTITSSSSSNAAASTSTSIRRTRTRTSTMTSGSAGATVTLATAKKQKAWSSRQRARFAEVRAARRVAEKEAAEVKAKLASF